MANDFNIADGPQVPDGVVRTGQTGQLILGDDGTNLQTIQVTPAGILKTEATVSGAAAPSHVTALASAARTSTTNSADQTNTGWNSLHAIMTITAGTGFSVFMSIEGYNPTGNNYYPIAVTPPITTQGVFVLKILPSAVLHAGAFADGLPATFRVRVRHKDTTSVTYSVGLNLQQV